MLYLCKRHPSYGGSEVSHLQYLFRKSLTSCTLTDMYPLLCWNERLKRRSVLISEEGLVLKRKAKKTMMTMMKLVADTQSTLH